jgi:beta-1,4-mannosyl-glycoprotein beta-1,4-N-acetylglucosaminyltransferase
MKKIKVFDCFPYFNEKEVLELRIKTLYNYVDGFYIVDADHTHGGHPKKFTCKKTLEQLNISLDKIHVIELNLPSFQENPNNYYRERLQRDILSKYFENDSVYIVTDCDEIIKPEMIPVYVEGAINNPDNIMRLSMDWLCCKANLHICDPKGIEGKWNIPFVCMKHHTNDYTLSQIRDDEACETRNIKYQSLYLQDQNKDFIKSGWHLSWMGDTERMKTKMRSFLHCYDDNKNIFQTAVGAVFSKEMDDYLNTYEPKVGSNDPFGRTDYFLKHYSVEKLPKLILELQHLKNFFGLNDE